MKKYIIIGLLFVLGIAIGMVITPVTLEISKQFHWPGIDQPAQQKIAPDNAVRAS